MVQDQKALDVPRWPLLVSIAAALGVMIIAGVLLLDLRANVATRAQENSENLLRVIVRDIARNVEIIDLSLQAVVEGVARRDVMEAAPELRRQILFNRSGTASGLGAFVVFDTNGVVTLDSSSNVPRVIQPVLDRDYFVAQRDGDDGLFISRPYLSRLIGRPVIGLSRRITTPDGAFGGVALATVEIAYFTRLLDQLRLGPSAVVSLVREDGSILVRHGAAGNVAPNGLSASPIFQRIRAEKSGTFVGLSAVDGVERIYTFAQVAKRPLYLTVAQATTDVFADWRSKAALLGLILVTICATIVALMAVLTRELKRSAVAEHALARSNTELARLSATDALTGLCNRRSFDKLLARELRRARRTGNVLSLLLLDVDHFKRFNDRYGHQEGDRVLVAIAEAIQRSCGRPADTAFRVGGEEFALLLPETGLTGASQVAERIRTAVRALAWPHSGSPSGIVTTSLGLIEISDEDEASAFARADGALYASKREGRDRTTAAPRRRLAA